MKKAHLSSKSCLSGLFTVTPVLSQFLLVLLFYSSWEGIINNQITEACSGTTYPTQSYQLITTAILAQQADKQLGEGYFLTRPCQSTIIQVTTNNGKLTLHVRVTGSYAYQFTLEQQAHIKTLIAGESKAQAVALLLHIPRVQSVSLTLNTGGTLPTDTARIHMIQISMS